MADRTYDLAIVGGGPAGLAAAVYAARERQQVLVLDKVLCGGAPLNTDLIENYPGFPEGIEGAELSGRMRSQAARFGAEFVEFCEASGLSRRGGLIEIACPEGPVRARALILAAGGEPKRLGIPGEEEFAGRGVSYCATCDGPLYRDKPVAVVGGGNTAMEEALFLTRFAERVFLVHRRNRFRGAKILEERLRAEPKAELVLEARPLRVEGKASVEALVAAVAGGERRIPAAAVFFFVGYRPNSLWLGGSVDLDEEGRVVTDSRMRTSLEGVFAAGDLRAGNLRQVSIAVGEGTTAALAARDYLETGHWPERDRLKAEG